MNETDAEFILRMQRTYGMPAPFEVERMRRIGRDQRARRFAAVLRRPR